MTCVAAAAVALAVLVICAQFPTRQAPWTRRWPNDNGEHQLRISKDALDAILLFGANGRHEENILLERVGERVRLRAWWMAGYDELVYEKLFCLDLDLTPTRLQSLWEQLDQERAFSLRNHAEPMSHAMTYWLKLRRGRETHEAAAYGVEWHGSTSWFGEPSIPEAWPRVIQALLDLRGEFAHHVRPARFNEDGSIDWRPEIVPRLLVDEIAERWAARLLNKIAISWEEVLGVGRCCNRVVVEAIVTLLEHRRPEIASAACAVLSWVSGKEPEASPRHWLEWWRESAGSYTPRWKSSLAEGPYGNGALRGLCGYAEGFVGVELDDSGGVWAIVDDGRAFNLYRHDAGSDRFVRTTISGVFDVSDMGRPAAALVRVLGESAIELPIHQRNVWISPDGRLGATVLAHESKYAQDSLVLLDFSRKSMREVVQTDLRFAGPVVSSDGEFIAVAKGWNWANPHGVVVIEVATVIETQVPIPPALSLVPDAYVNDSAHGSGFLLVRREAPPHRGELWWCSPSGREARKMLDVPEGIELGSARQMQVTMDGLRILCVRDEASDSGPERGWLRIEDSRFEPIFRGYSGSADSNSDGSRVVFLHQGQVFEWRRSE